MFLFASRYFERICNKIKAFFCGAKEKLSGFKAEIRFIKLHLCAYDYICICVCAYMSMQIVYVYM